MDILNTINTLSNFIYEEKSAEEQEYEQLHSNFTTNELISMGFCLSNLQYVKSKTLFYKKTLIIFQYYISKENGVQSKLKQNDIVYLIKKNDNKDKKIPILRGTLYQLRANQLRFLVDEKDVPEDKLNQQGLCLIKALDNVTYERFFNKS